jgi:CRISPR-associated protein Csx17
MPELVLHGCTPEPLMLYLKALGIVQFVAEQTVAKAREAWRCGIVLLSWAFDEDSLTGFF